MLLEALVSFVIFSIGLLGLAALLSRGQQAEMESYQRSQALMLLDDMAHRIQASVSGAPSITERLEILECYDQGAGLDTPLGTGVTYSNISCGGGTLGTAITQVINDNLQTWDGALDGGAEQFGGENVGAMVGARGCVYRNDNATATDFSVHVAIAWQGLSATFAPTSSTCGESSYGDETLRRVVVRDLYFADIND